MATQYGGRDDVHERRRRFRATCTFPVNYNIIRNGDTAQIIHTAQRYRRIGLEGVTHG
jgi:hypothetical protein